MAYIVILYESLSGNVERMAQAVAEGVSDAGLEPRLRECRSGAAPDSLLDEIVGAAGLIVGSYTSYGLLAGGTKEFFDASFRVHGKLQGKVGGAFASSGGLGGGNETTVMAILQALLVHGFIIQGDPESPHFGAVSIGAPDAQALDASKRLGQRVGELAKRVAAPLAKH